MPSRWWLPLLIIGVNSPETSNRTQEMPSVNEDDHDYLYDLNDDDDFYFLA